MPTGIRDTMQEVSNFVYKAQLAQHAISKVRQLRRFNILQDRTSGVTKLHSDRTQATKEHNPHKSGGS